MQRIRRRLPFMSFWPPWVVSKTLNGMDKTQGFTFGPRRAFTFLGRTGGAGEVPMEPHRQVSGVRAEPSRYVPESRVVVIRTGPNLSLCLHLPPPAPRCCCKGEFLRALNQGGQCEAVVSHFEAGRVAFSQETLGEYIKALARLDRLSGSRVMSVMQVVLKEHGLTMPLPHASPCKPPMHRLSEAPCEPMQAPDASSLGGFVATEIA